MKNSIIQLTKTKQQNHLENADSEDCFNLGLRYSNQGELSLAIREFIEAIRLNPNSYKAYFHRGTCYIKQENYDMALVDLNKAIDINHDYFEAYNNIGLCLLIQENYDLAILNFSKAIKLNPSLCEAYHNRCYCYLSQKKYAAALDDATKYIELNPNDSEGYAIRGKCYQNQRKYDFSILDYTKCIELKNDNKDVFFSRGKCYFAQKKNKLALNDFSKSIELITNDPDIYYYRGACYELQHDFKLALVDYTKSIELNPNSCDAYYARGFCYLMNNDFTCALVDFAECIKLNSSFHKAYSARCTSYLKLGRYDFSLNEIDNAINFCDTLKQKNKYCIDASNISILVRKYDRARYYIQEAFKNHDSEDQHHKNIYLKNIQKAEELDIKNKELTEKNKELNNLVAMFAHNFLGTLHCIRSNAEHDNNPNIHLKTVRMMGGALTAFSILSADDKKLVDQLKQDNMGEANLLQSLTNNLALAVSQLLGIANKDKIINLYLNYLRKTQQIEQETTSEALRENREYREKWQSLQSQWEDAFNNLFSDQVELLVLQKWITDNFFPIEIIGFDSCQISFKEYGITDSIFLIVFMEIFVNAFKYMDVNANKPLVLRLCEDDQYYNLVFENPSSLETGRGTHKGMDFLSTIAKKLSGQFITESTENSFKTTFAIPSVLLK